MYQELDEPIDVIAVYEKGILRPLRFLWKDHSHKITHVTGTWKSPKGESWLQHFSIVDAQGTVFHLTYYESRTRWAISKVWVE